MSNYTQINVRVTGQAIQRENDPLIASGGVKSVKVHFTFCSMWDGMAKTAVFYADPKQSYRILLDEDDSAIVPSEVIDEHGEFCVGVFGVNDEQVFPSNFVRVTILKGAASIETVDPAEPTPDIYQQLLAAYNELVKPEGKAAVIRVRDTNGGRDVTFWIGTVDQYNAIETKAQNCIYIKTDEPPIVAHTAPAEGVLVRWFADGYAEAWVRYRVPNVTTPHEFGALYLSSRFTLAFPDVYTSTTDQEMPVVCEASLVGAESADNTEPILLFSSGSDDGYASNMRFYIGTTRQLTEETPVHIRMHLVWRYKTA